MYLKISNKGEVESQAFSLLGASTKLGSEGKIGMFGSGNKYALAYLLRNNYNILMFSGGTEITVGTVKKEFRENTFDVICINDKETSITTQSGPKWELWQAIRELYSNAIDEGVVDFKLTDDVESDQNITSIYIEAKPELIELFNNIDDYFAMTKTVLFESELGKIYRKKNQETLIYRKGIRCYEATEKSLFDYDFNDISINESRLIDSTFRMYELISTMLYTTTNKEIIRKFYSEIGKDILEMRCFGNFVSRKSETLSEEWINLLPCDYFAPEGLQMFMEENEIDRTYFMPMAMFKDFQNRFGEDRVCPSMRKTVGGVFYKEYEMNELQKAMLKDVLYFFEECNFNIDYQIEVVKFDNVHVHGKAIDNKILISCNAFDKGKEWLANVIIEEQIHLKYDVRDETRAFQDAVISELIVALKKAYSFNL